MLKYFDPGFCSCGSGGWTRFLKYSGYLKFVMIDLNFVR